MLKKFCQLVQLLVLKKPHKYIQGTKIERYYVILLGMMMSGHH